MTTAAITTPVRLPLAFLRLLNICATGLASTTTSDATNATLRKVVRTVAKAARGTSEDWCHRHAANRTSPHGEKLWQVVTLATSVLASVQHNDPSQELAADVRALCAAIEAVS